MKLLFWSFFSVAFSFFLVLVGSIRQRRIFFNTIAARSQNSIQLECLSTTLLSPNHWHPGPMPSSWRKQTKAALKGVLMASGAALIPLCWASFVVSVTDSLVWRRSTSQTSYDDFVHG